MKVDEMKNSKENSFQLDRSQKIFPADFNEQFCEAAGFGKSPHRITRSIF